MPGNCSIVMYHYVRELPETRYARIRGLTVTKFRAQLAYLLKYYEFVSMEDLLDACHGHGVLPRNAAILSFDDGYSDHYQNVFPILDEAGIQGCFFPPVRAVSEGRVLDVNKIHFVLASASSVDRLIEDVFQHLDRLRIDGHELASNDDLYEQFAHQGKFDSPQLTFIKRLLQKGLPENVRSEVVDALFRGYVTGDERAFARELYVTVDQLKMMKRHGMIIGSHGYSHRWLDTLSSAEQRQEIESSLEFLQNLGISREGWVMCYPHGAHNASLRLICAELGCGLAVTTETAIARIEKTNALELPRLDTNYLPTEVDAEPVAWTMSVMEENHE